MKDQEIQLSSAYEVCPIKQTIDSTDHNFIYQSKINRIYQWIYFAFGLFFMLLGLVVLYKTNNWAGALHFQRFELVKTFTYSFCFLLSLGALGLTYAMKSDEEITEDIISVFKKKLERVYRDLCSMNANHPQFSQFYQETKEKIERKKKKTLQRLLLIKQASTLDYQAKEQLCHEIYHDLQTKLRNVLHYFRDSVVSAEMVAA